MYLKRSTEFQKNNLCLYTVVTILINSWHAFVACVIIGLVLIWHILNLCDVDGRINYYINIAPGDVVKPEDDINTVSDFYPDYFTDIGSVNRDSIVFCDKLIAKVYVKAVGDGWGRSGRHLCWFLWCEQRRQSILRLRWHRQRHNSGNLGVGFSWDPDFQAFVGTLVTQVCTYSMVTVFGWRVREIIH